MLIRNGKVFDVNKGFVTADIVIDESMIMSVNEKSNAEDEDINDMEGRNKVTCNEPDGACIDATGLYVIPGLVDIHFHGCMGYDFSDGTLEALEKMAEYEASNGITAMCPASMTYDETRLARVFSTAVKYRDSYDCYKAQAELVGINMEGPFISEDKRGAQNKEYICNPDVDMFDRLKKAADGMIRVVDIAPEMDGAMEFIESVASSVRVSLAHTNADYDTTMRAFDKGADHVTHLYNAMPPFHHRNPGVVGAAADRENVYVELIGDGVHCSPATVRATFKMFGEDRIVLISDSMEACGMPDGEYELGGQKVIVKGSATLEDGTIAGSVANLMDCVRVLVKSMNIPLAAAIKCASFNPAKSIGISDRYGSLEPGRIANIVLLNENLDIVRVILRGQL